MPENETARAVILAQLHVPIPPEHITWDAIREWIEATIEGPKPWPEPGRSFIGQIMNPGGRVVPVINPDELEYLLFPISGRAREHGRCSYHVNQRGQGNFNLQKRMFLRLLANCSNMEEVVSSLTDRISDDWEGCVNFDDVGDYDYDDHERDEEDGLTDKEWEYTNSIRVHLRELIQQHAPQEWTRLQANE